MLRDSPWVTVVGGLAIAHLLTFSLFILEHLACGQFCSSRRVGPMSLRLFKLSQFPELIEGAEPNAE
jgi:hypothetical protein